MDEDLSRAIWEFALNRVVPTFQYDAEMTQPKYIFTSTLLRSDDRLFLITARHNLDDWGDSVLAIPSAPKNSHVRGLGNVNFIKPDDEYLDVAIVELLDTEVKKEIQSGWSTVNREDIQKIDSDKKKFLFGYPASDIRTAPEKIVGKPLAIFTESLKGVPEGAEKPIFSNVDQFYVHEQTVEKEDGRVAELPDFKGMSGCAIWQYTELSPGELWAGSKVLKVVGIQSAYVEGEYLRAKSWDFVEGILKRI